MVEGQLLEHKRTKLRDLSRQQQLVEEDKGMEEEGKVVTDVQMASLLGKKRRANDSDL